MGLRTGLLAIALFAGSCATIRSPSPPVHVIFDYGGAEALTEVVERRAITDGEIDALLAVRGVRGMVSNVTRFFPDFGDDDFRKSVRGWVERRDPGERVFALRHVAAGAEQTKATTASVQAREIELRARIARDLGPFMPIGAPNKLTAYFVAGGVSDGFVLESDSEPAFYQAIDRAKGDPEGLVLVATHELYHAVQNNVRKRAGLEATVGNLDSVDAPVRLLTVTLDEGTANFVADPTKTNASGAYIQIFRDRYLHHRSPARIAADFALFDTLLADLAAKRISWSQAYQQGFSGGGVETNPLYFVGYEIAKALEREHGPGRIATAFAAHPARFFQDYIELYRNGAKVPARFSPATERMIERMAGGKT